MSEWNENKLDQELEALMNEIPEQDALEKKINQSIDRRIRKIVLRTVSSLVVVVLIACLIINPLMNKMFFDPYAMNEGEEQKMLGVLRDYMEMTQPYREVVSLEVERKGFGRYELAMQVADLTEYLSIGEPNVWCEINFGRYENIIDSEKVVLGVANRFALDGSNQEEMLERIQELPESAIIYLSVRDTIPKTVEELRNLTVKAEWMQVYQPAAKLQCGLCLSPNALYEEDDQREEMTEEELKRVYLSNLSNVLNNEEALPWWKLCSGDGVVYANTQKMLQETYKNAMTLTELKSINYSVWGKREEVVEFLQENTLESIYIEYVRLW